MSKRMWFCFLYMLMMGSCAVLPVWMYPYIDTTNGTPWQVIFIFVFCLAICILMAISVIRFQDEDAHDPKLSLIQFFKEIRKDFIKDMKSYKEAIHDMKTIHRVIKCDHPNGEYRNVVVYNYKDELIMEFKGQMKAILNYDDDVDYDIRIECGSAGKYLIQGSTICDRGDGNVVILQGENEYDKIEHVKK